PPGSKLNGTFTLSPETTSLSLTTPRPIVPSLSPSDQQRPDNSNSVAMKRRPRVAKAPATVGGGRQKQRRVQFAGELFPSSAVKLDFDSPAAASAGTGCVADFPRRILVGVTNESHKKLSSATKDAVSKKAAAIPIADFPRRILVKEDNHQSAANTGAGRSGKKQQLQQQKNLSPVATMPRRVPVTEPKPSRKLASSTTKSSDLKWNNNRQLAKTVAGSRRGFTGGVDASNASPTRQYIAASGGGRVFGSKLPVRKAVVAAEAPKPLPRLRFD
ncbi:hypothetical protein BOX15_Mlig012209g2, partial [Macrostomum lignano]